MEDFQIHPIALETTLIFFGLVLVVLEAFREPICEKMDRSGSIKDLNTENFASTMNIIALGLIGVVFASTFAPMAEIGGAMSQLYVADAQALFFKRLALLSTFLVLLMARDFVPTLRKYIFSENSNAGLSEFFALPIFTCVGLMLMASAKDFIMIFVALELVTISFYILVSYMRRSGGSLEAGVKYLILGALSTGFFVYGITWIFGMTGSTNLEAISAALPGMDEGKMMPLLFGIGLLIVGLGFKVAAAPFQIWVPDVYQGAPTPVTAFLSVGSKAAGFIVLYRVFEAFSTLPAEQLNAMLVIMVAITVATLLYGNLAALPQTNFKRLLAYSSIAHAGYLLIAIITGNTDALGFYLWAYLLMTMLAFLIMIVVNQATGGDDVSHFNGLMRRSKLLTVGMIVAMLSLAGMPLTAGFVGKLFIFMGAVSQGQWLLCIIGAISVAAGFYYYLKVVRAMCLEEPADESPIQVSMTTRVAIVVLVAALIVFGLVPTPILAMLP
jgi:NADH-quinone oxidoreductase subunit N